MVVQSFVHFTGRCSTASRTTRTGTTFSVSSLLSAACSQPCLFRVRARVRARARARARDRDRDRGRARDRIGLEGGRAF